MVGAANSGGAMAVQARRTRVPPAARDVAQDDRAAVAWRARDPRAADSRSAVLVRAADLPSVCRGWPVHGNDRHGADDGARGDQDRIVHRTSDLAHLETVLEAVPSRRWHQWRDERHDEHGYVDGSDSGGTR